MIVVKSNNEILPRQNAFGMATLVKIRVREFASQACFGGIIIDGLSLKSGGKSCKSHSNAKTVVYFLCDFSYFLPKLC